jgi:hypothetical protein
MAQNLASANGSVFPRPNVVFIREGKTTRDEVLRAFEHMDTNASMDGLFWARWQQVKVQVEWFIAGASPNVGMGAAGGSERAWKILNVFALFDESHSVRYYRLCKETNVISNLQDILSQIDPAPDVSSDLVLPASHHHPPFNSHGRGRVIFEKGALSFEEPKTPEHNFGLPLSAIERLNVAFGSSPEILRLRLNLRQDKSSREFILEASPSETVRLVALIDSARR